MFKQQGSDDLLMFILLNQVTGGFSSIYIVRSVHEHQNIDSLPTRLWRRLEISKSKNTITTIVLPVLPCHDQLTVLDHSIRSSWTNRRAVLNSVPQHRTTSSSGHIYFPNRSRGRQTTTAMAISARERLEVSNYGTWIPLHTNCRSRITSVESYD